MKETTIAEIRKENGMIPLSIKLKEAEKMALKLRASRLGFRSITAYLRAAARDELTMLNRLAESSKFTA